MTELERFKRRLIRSVERLLIKEKMPEEAAWEELKKETGNNCKNIWLRMKSLTLKKMQRLISVSDSVDAVPPTAQMTATDWMLVDLVLVHQDDVDLIDKDGNSKEDRKVLEDLFELVEIYEIEMRHGTHLADAWADLTKEYNNYGRSVSPMVLQRRWYQMKLSTRDSFYNYWYAYRGTHTRLAAAEQFKPSPLRIQIAKRHKEIVTCRFVEWEELVEQRCVIMADEFENATKKKSYLPATPKKKEDKPDIEVIEPVIETITLDDSDNEETKQIDTPIKSPEITIKDEPLDYDEENYTLTNSEKKNIYDEVLESLEKEDLDNLEVTVVENIANVDSNVSTNEAIDLEQDRDVTPGLIKTEDLNESEIVIENEGIGSIDNTDEIVLPQITNVFGNVNVSTETIGKIAMMVEQRDDIIKDRLGIQEVHEDNVENEKLSVKNEDLHVDDKVVDKTNPKEKQDEEINYNPEENLDIKPVVNQFSLGEVSNDINFADDGIEFLDDGIIDSGEDEQTDEITKAIQKVVEKALEQIEQPKIDKKLLLVPTVYLQRLEECITLTTYDHVGDRQTLDIIDSKSKPIMETVTDKNDINSDTGDIVTFKVEADDSVDENSNDYDHCNIKRVRLSSALLQKPCNRDYNPFQLCKNPDFNTRLKRLNLGFFGYPTNRVLLKSCKPLTVDLSNAFESRLVEGTLYLENDGNNVPIEVNNHVVNQNAVLPTAMTVQSLINNVVENVVSPPLIAMDIPNKSTDSEVVLIGDTSTTTKSSDCEVTGSIRNKVINLPDISEIRRINQKLLTAEVTPIVVNNTTQVRGAIEIDPKPISKAAQNKNLPTNKKPGPKCRKTPICPWLGTPFAATVPWNATVKITDYSKDNTLLTVDALNKMLFVFSNKVEEQKALFKVVKKKIKKNKDKWAENHGIKTQSPGDEAPSTSEIRDTDEQQNGEEQKKETICEEQKKDKSEATKPQIKKSITKLGRPPVRNRKKMCCWAAKLIAFAKDSRRRIFKHDCAYPNCNCCCRLLLEWFVRKEYSVKEEEFRDLTGLAQTNYMHRIILTNRAKYFNTLKNKIVTETRPTEPEKQDKSEHITECLSDRVVSTEVYSHVTVKKPVVIDLDADTPEISSNRTADATPVTIDLDADNAGSDYAVTASEDTTTDITTTETTTLEVTTPEITTPEITTLGANVTVANKESNENSSDELEPATDMSGISQDNLVEVEVANDDTPKESSNAVTAPSIKVKIFARDSPPHPVPYKAVPSSKNRPKLLINPAPDVPKPVELNLKTTPVKEHREINAHIITTHKTYPGVRPTTTPNPLKSRNETIIYLNRKARSGLSNSDPPIYLGHNKILLTTVVIPRILRYLEEFKENPNKMIYAPQGVQLTLLPCNTVSYILDPNKIANAQELTLLPEIISQVQKKVNRIVSQSKGVPVINLDEESPKTPPLTNTEENNSGDSVNCDNIPNTKVDTMINNSQADDSQSSENLTEKTISDAAENVDNSKDSPIKVPVETDVTNDLTTSDSQNVGNNITDIAEQINDENSGETDKTNDINETDNATKPKNILSDLMEMSGISAEDFVSPQQEETETVAKPAVTTVSLLDTIVRPCPTDGEVEESSTLIKTPCGLLSSVTSFMQLKYAVGNKGKFYKLDLSTGILVTINVCIKQKDPRPRSTTVPSSVIDLTDDVNSEEPPVVNKETPVITKETPVKIKETPTTSAPEGKLRPTGNSRSLLQTNRSTLFVKHNSKINKSVLIDNRRLGLNRSVLIDKQNVKPVKLFKTSTNTTNPLQAHLKERYRHVFQKHFDPTKTKRNKNINLAYPQLSTSKNDDRSIDSDSADETVPNTEKVSQKRAAESDSSDDEPIKTKRTKTISLAYSQLSKPKNDGDSIDSDSADETVPNNEKESQKRGAESDSSDDEPLSKVANKKNRLLLKCSENIEPSSSPVENEGKTKSGDGANKNFSGKTQTVTKDSALGNMEDGSEEVLDEEVLDEELLNEDCDNGGSQDESEAMSLVEEPMDFTDDSDDDSDHCILGV